LSDQKRFRSQRGRTLLGLGVVAASLLVASVLAGIGFARSSSGSAAQYQYGKVTICHHTHSAKNPTVTITISEHAWLAQWHKTHPDDTLGPCKTPDKGKGKGKNKTPTTGTPTTSSPTPSSPGNSGGDHGKPSGTPGNGPGGNGKGHGKGK